MNESKCGDLKCVQKPPRGRLSLTHLLSECTYCSYWVNTRRHAPRDNHRCLLFITDLLPHLAVLIADNKL